MNDMMRQWRNDPRIYRWCRQNDLITDKDQEGWFERQNSDSSIRMYAIWCATKEAQKPIGVCGLTDIDLVNSRAEFSLYLAPHMHGQGLAPIALKLLFGRGFEDLGLKTIWGETFRGNKALRMFEKFGMRVEGWRRNFYYKEGSFLDAALVSMTREEWDGLSDSDGSSDLDTDASPDVGDD
jgi:RimJ/RimL family protein N-acetyltransferase